MRKQYHFRPVDNHTLIWDIHRLIKLSRNFPVKEVDINAIRELDEPYWFGDERTIPSCRVIGEHAKLISETDLNHPIILSQDGGVMDGMHRVVKAMIAGKTRIKAIQFAEDPEPDFKDVDSRDLPYNDSTSDL